MTTNRILQAASSYGCTHIVISTEAGILTPCTLYTRPDSAADLYGPHPHQGDSEMLLPSLASQGTGQDIGAPPHISYDKDKHDIVWVTELLQK